jgi:hypothetical protein
LLLHSLLLLFVVVDYVVRWVVDWYCCSTLFVRCLRPIHRGNIIVLFVRGQII